MVISFAMPPLLASSGVRSLRQCRHVVGGASLLFLLGMRCARTTAAAARPGEGRDRTPLCGKWDLVFSYLQRQLGATEAALVSVERHRFSPAAQRCANLEAAARSLQADFGRRWFDLFKAFLPQITAVKRAFATEKQRLFNYLLGQALNAWAHHVRTIAFLHQMSEIRDTELPSGAQLRHLWIEQYLLMHQRDGWRFMRTLRGVVGG